MPKLYNAPKYRASTRTYGILLGIGVSGLLFLAVPLTQIFNKFDKSPEQIEAIDLAPPPPPPPPEDPPEPPPPEEEEPPPELSTPPPPISLEQLDMALNPGTGGSMAGDFALPNFDVSKSDLGGVEMFDIMDVDKKPRLTKPTEPRIRGQQGIVTLRFTVNQFGKVQNIRIHQSSNPKLNKPCTDAVRRWEFVPGEKNGRTIITNNVQQRFTFN